tara:strand:+ start:222 stop:401 length:180 start_codon:yes stop_codon:yes gene_type:complete
MNKPTMTIINFNGEVDEFIIEDPRTAYERTCSFLDQGLKNKNKQKTNNETKKVPTNSDL